MWYILGNHSRIVLSKLCPKTKQFPSFVSRNIRQNAKPGINKPVIQGEFLQAPTWSDLIKPAIFTGVFGTSVMTGAFIWKYENSRKKEQKFLDPVIKYFSNLPPPPKVRKFSEQLSERIVQILTQRYRDGTVLSKIMKLGLSKPIFYIKKHQNLSIFSLKMSIQTHLFFLIPLFANYKFRITLLLK